jgi:hypothetical protein
MAGIKDRVKGFLASWPKIIEQLEESEDEGLLYGERACGSLWGEQQDDLQKALGPGDTRF